MTITLTTTSNKSIISPQPTKLIPTTTATSTLNNTTTVPTTIDNNNNNTQTNITGICLFSLSPTPTPRSTPFYLDQYGLEELDENESIISELSSSYQSQSILQDYHHHNQNHNQSHHHHDFIYCGNSHTQQITTTSVSPLKPSPRPKTLLAPYIFYATNLLHLSNHFINCEFDSFSNHVILNPNIPKIQHTSIISQLKEMYNLAIELKDAVLQFNKILGSLKTQQMSVITFKKNLDLIVDNELNIPVHTIVDQIIDGLYQYNLTIEDCLNDESSDDLMDEETCQIIKDYHFKIESLLYLNDCEFNITHVEKFYNLLMNFCTD